GGRRRGEPPADRAVEPIPARVVGAHRVTRRATLAGGATGLGPYRAGLDQLVVERAVVPERDVRARLAVVGEELSAVIHRVDEWIMHEGSRVVAVRAAHEVRALPCV